MDPPVKLRNDVSESQVTEQFRLLFYRSNTVLAEDSVRSLVKRTFPRTRW